MGFNNTSGITFTLEKVSRMSIFVLYSHFVRIVERLSLIFLFLLTLELTKNMLVQEGVICFQIYCRKLMVHAVL